MQHGHETQHCELVTHGGQKETTIARSPFVGELTHLICNHEGADTHIVLHTSDVKQSYNRVVVVCKDTHVFLILTHFLGRVKEVQTWMSTGSVQQ